MPDKIEATVGGETVELPRYDLALARKADAVDAAEGGEATWRAEWDFLRAALGEDALREAVGGSRVDSCDLIALDRACAEVMRAYDAPRQESTRRRVEESLSVFGDGDLDRLVRAAEAIDRLGSRQGFRRVK